VKFRDKESRLARDLSPIRASLCGAIAEIRVQKVSCCVTLSSEQLTATSPGQLLFCLRCWMDSCWLGSKLCEWVQGFLGGKLGLFSAGGRESHAQTLGGNVTTADYGKTYDQVGCQAEP
jgi:hypothetical protein